MRSSNVSVVSSIVSALYTRFDPVPLLDPFIGQAIRWKIQYKDMGAEWRRCVERGKFLSVWDDSPQSQAQELALLRKQVADEAEEERTNPALTQAEKDEFARNREALRLAEERENIDDHFDDVIYRYPTQHTLRTTPPANTSLPDFNFEF